MVLPIYETKKSLTFNIKSLIRHQKLDDSQIKGKKSLICQKKTLTLDNKFLFWQQKLDDCQGGFPIAIPRNCAQFLGVYRARNCARVKSTCVGNPTAQ